MNTKILRFLPLVLALSACAERKGALPTTESPLDLERVVLYRNGVGYFERHGEVEGNELRIRVRRDQVDDLLKSLTVIDENGRALSISMPLDPESWASAALSNLGPGRGSLAQVLDGLRGTQVMLHTSVGRLRGRIVMVERSVDEPDPDRRIRSDEHDGPSSQDFKVTLLDGDRMKVVRLSKVRDITLLDGDLALQLNRRLDASAGEGMFQQVEVAIRLAGADKHDLRVSYVVAAPMWKPTYRVVLPEDGNGDALLQAWAVVDNTSGEDWTSVGLSLTSGEPIAFQYDLHTPRNVGRVDLTESGVRKRAVVAVGETTWTESDEEDADGDDDEYAEIEEEFANEKSSSRKFKKKSAPRTRAPMGAAASEPAPVMADESGFYDGKDLDASKSGVAAAALRRSTQASARAKQVSGQTRFELQDEVTVPNGSSTMVAILNRDVAAEQTFLFRPGGAGMGYESNPYRVVRFKNTTGFVLEPGPISIYAGGSFVGEGLSEAVGSNTSATIPFAVEPSIIVNSTMRHKGGEMQIVRIVRGVLEVQNFSRTETTWTVRGRDKSGYTVLVRQNKAGSNYELKDPPKGTETLPNAYLIPVAVPKGKLDGTMKVVEETPSQTTLTIWDGRAVGLLDKLVVHASLTAQMRKTLQPIVDLRREIGRIDTLISGLQQQKYEADQRLNETRQNLEAIKKDPAATSLRKKLSARMNEFSKQGDAVSRQVVELQSTRLEKKIELEDLLETIDLRAPQPPKTKGK